MNGRRVAGWSRKAWHPVLPRWRYWWSSFEAFYVHWSRDKLSKIAGHAETVARLTYK